MGIIAMITSIDELAAYMEGILHVWPQYRDEFHDIIIDAQYEYDRTGADSDPEEEQHIVNKFKAEIDKYKAP